MNETLMGRVAWVTGGGSGIGLAEVPWNKGGLETPPEVKS
jgi:hypothetical protein